MKNLTIIAANFIFCIAVLCGCSGNQSSENSHEAEIIKLDSTTQVIENHQKEIESSSKKLDSLLNGI